MRDQATALYAWEEAWASWNVSTTSLAECRDYVRQACAAYGVPAPKVTGHKHREMSYYRTDIHKISLRYDHKNIAIALHEAAHAIIYHYYQDTVKDHGPEFMGVYLHLLVEAKLAPPVAITASAKAAKLRWSKNMTPADFAARFGVT